jgi:glycosyltransferase involved in cell wall biosynthesis
MVGIEAMSYGRPVVAFNVGGIPEWLEDGATGFLVRPHDTRELASKITYLLEKPFVAREMGRKGRERVRAKFSKEKHVADLLRAYGEIRDGRVG